jgi:hypothetical protein
MLTLLRWLQKAGRSGKGRRFCVQPPSLQLTSAFGRVVDVRFLHSLFRPDVPVLVSTWILLLPALLCSTLCQVIQRTTSVCEFVCCCNAPGSLISTSVFSCRPKYSIRENRSAYKVFMWLVIRSFGSTDIGTYNCVSTNSLGRAEGTLRLYGESDCRWTLSTVMNQFIQF